MGKGENISPSVFVDPRKEQGRVQEFLREVKGYTGHILSSPLNLVPA